MNILKKCFLIAAMLFCSTTFANTYTSDLSDLWWNENEPGWGINVNHQREVVFLTFFVYGKDGRVSWFTGQASHAGQTPQGALIFTGGMYEFSGGTWFGAAFNPANVTGRSAGTVSFTAYLDRATLSYTIDGVAVNKVVTRQTFRNNDLSGAYMGAIKQIKSGCIAPAVSGETNSNAEISVNNTSTTLSMTIRQANGNSCSYAGNYSQNGRLGRSQGSYSCTGGVNGTYDAFELDANVQHFSGRFISSDNSCDTVGRFAAMRK